MNDQGSPALMVVMEDFRWHYNEMLKYIDSLNHFSNLQLVTLGAVAAGLTALVSQGQSSYYIVLFVLLLAPMPFNFIAWSYEHCHLMIAANARYITYELRPKMIAMTKDEEVLTWDRFLTKDTFSYKSKFALSSSIGYGNAYLLSSVVTIAALFVSVVLFIQISMELSLVLKCFGAVIALIDVSLLMLTIRNHRLVGGYFSHEYELKASKGSASQ